ncbi:unnamed protein product, partial [Rotaria sp. Silwood2]
MASSIRKQCRLGDECKQSGVAHCEGCQQIFCIEHFNEHRQSLSEDLDIIIGEHDHFKERLIHKSSNLGSLLLLEKINKWEKESMMIIQQSAELLRNQLIELETDRTNELSKKLQSFSEQLQKALEQRNYIERDLQHWKSVFDDLKFHLDSSSTIDINQHATISLVLKPYIDVKITNDT